MKDLFVQLAQLQILNGKVCEAADHLRGAMLGNVTDADDVEDADAAFNRSLLTLSTFVDELRNANERREVGISFVAEEVPAEAAQPSPPPVEQPIHAS